MDEEFNAWVAKTIPPHRPMSQVEMFYIKAAWFVSARRADRMARLDCAEIADGFGATDLIGQEIAAAIRATIPEGPT